jgi:hypothetical protein
VILQAWTQERVNFKGVHFNIEDSRSQAAAKPYPPVWVLLWLRLLGGMRRFRGLFLMETSTEIYRPSLSQSCLEQATRLVCLLQRDHVEQNCGNSIAFFANATRRTWRSGERLNQRLWKK